MDLTGTVRSQWRRSYDEAKTGRFLIRKAREAVEFLMEPLALPQKDKIRGLGVCVPGFLRREEQTVVRSVNISGFQEFSIAKAFGEIDLPLILEESSRSMALAEKWFGARESDRNLICMDLGYGIGMGIIHRGVLYRGANEAGGEIGHTVVDASGPVCHCGKRGCLEAVASGKALGEVAAGLRIGGRQAGARGAAALHEAALGGNRPARQALQRAGQYIGIAVANIINLFDPGLVVLNGGLVKAGDVLIGRLKETVEQHRLKGAGRACRIEISALGGFAAAMGAAMLPLRTYFEFDNIQL
jgi:glucokinase